MPIHKTTGVQLSTIQYGCGCISEMDKMRYCPLHGAAPDLLAASKAALSALKHAEMDMGLGPIYRIEQKGLEIAILKAQGRKS